MKRNILFLLSVSILLFSCNDSDDLIKRKALIIIHDENITTTNTKSSQHISFETNMDWVAESSESWCKVYPAIGDSSMKGTTLTVSTNEEDEKRSCFITITAGGVSKSVSISQHGNIYWVKEMGTLGLMLDQTQKETIAKMIVKGEINKADFDVMKLEMPKLKYIDLKEVKCEGDKIPDFAFGGYSFNKVITTIILPESIKEIGISAFSNCYGLTGNLTLPEGVTTIGNSAFISCSGFTGNLILPNKISTIGANAFQYCSGFTGLILPDGLTTIGMSAFAYCSGFTGNLTLPDGLTTIGSGAFYNSRFTGNLILPDGVTTIGSLAFGSCSGFTGLTIGKSLTTIDNWAFYGCENLSGNIVFPNRLSSIRQNAFTNSYNVAAFQFPHTIPLGYYPNMLPSGATVKVPTSAVATYKATNGWKDHTIVGY